MAGMASLIRRNAPIDCSIAVTAMLVAACLLYLSLPRFQADLAMQSGNRIKAIYLQSLRDDGIQMPSAAELEVWAMSRHDALAWYDSADAWEDLVLINTLRAWQSDISQERRELYSQAKQNALHALARNPGSGLLWLRLAVIDSNMGQPAPVVLVSLSKSIDTALYEPQGFYNRLMLGFRYWAAASPELREQLLQQLPLMAVAQDWNGIKKLAAHYPAQIPMMRQRLQDTPRALAAIDKAEANLARP